MLALDLGSGANPVNAEGMTMVHLDLVEGPKVSLVCDLNNGIPTPSNIFDVVFALDVIEHLQSVVEIMNEMHRVLIPGGKAYIRVPLWGSFDHQTDPTHVRGFTEQSFDFFDDSTEFGLQNGQLYTPHRWEILKKDLNTTGGSLCLEMEALKPNIPDGWRSRWALDPRSDQ